MARVVPTARRRRYTRGACAPQIKSSVENLPHLIRALCRNAGQQLDEPLERNFVARIGDELEISRRILDVRLLEEPDAAGDGEGDLPPGQLQLQFERVEMRPVKHGDIVQVHAFLRQFHHALRDERGLLPGVHARDQRGLEAGFARRREVLGKLIHVRGDGGVGDVEDFRRAAVIGFDLENLRAGITLGEFEDVREIRAAPGVDALGVVADHRDVVMARGQQVNQIALELVRVLVFVHEDELEAALVMFAHVGVVLKELEPEREQVVEIHRVGRALALGVKVGQAGNFLIQIAVALVPVEQINELLVQQFADGFVRVDGEGENFIQHVRFGEMRAFGFDFGVGDAGLDQILGVVAVKNGEIAPVTERVGVGTEHAGADGMKGAAPKLAQLVAEQIGHAPHHFAGGLVGERQQQNPVGGDALLQQIGDAIGERARLARTRAGDDERRAGRRGDGGQLLRIQLARVINLRDGPPIGTVSMT